MKAIEFQTQLHNPATIDIPLSFQGKIKLEQKLKIIVFIEDDTADESWQKIATKQFFAGYADEDAIYDTLQ